MMPNDVTPARVLPLQLRGPPLSPWKKRKLDGFFTYAQNSLQTYHFGTMSKFSLKQSNDLISIDFDVIYQRHAMKIYVTVSHISKHKHSMSFWFSEGLRFSPTTDYEWSGAMHEPGLSCKRRLAGENVSMYLARGSLIRVTDTHVHCPISDGDLRLAFGVLENSDGFFLQNIGQLSVSLSWK